MGDQSLFPTKNPEEKETDEGTVKSKRGLFGRRKYSNESMPGREKKETNKDPRTPYEQKVDEYDKILQINKYSHGNPWINRVAVIIQPMVEIVQVPLFVTRA